MASIRRSYRYIALHPKVQAPNHAPGLENVQTSANQWQSWDSLRFLQLPPHMDGDQPVKSPPLHRPRTLS